MYIEVVTPKGCVFEGEVESVTLPGSEGQFQTLNNHAPIVSTLTAGTVKIEKGTECITYTIGGGLFELADNRANLLVESVVE